MDPHKAGSESKSLRKRGKQILGASFNTIGALLGNKSRKALEAPEKPSWYDDSWGSGGAGRFSMAGSSFEDLAEPYREDGPPISGGSGSSAVSGFLTKSPDPSWIDIEMIGYWLKKCDTEHGEQCRRPFGLDPLGLGQAQWLIDVRRKCLAPAKPENRYACLSYVWGGASTLKTGKDNLESLLEGDSLATHWNEIPKTIRDTVNLVDQLGIQYLWVDCLCIVQDDTESKHDQIQAMSGIYANAYVTIIAGNGWDANHGLRGIQGVTEPRHLSTFLKSDFRENLQPYSSIWYSRGWTFQEMIFSPRKIMFQYQLAIWECNNDSWHESSLCTIPTPLKASTFRPTVSPWQSRIEISAWPDIHQYISLAHDYARRKLTYGDDALHAITSLLSVMSTSFFGGFITGLPEMFFDEALLWQPAEPMQQRQSSEGRLAIPSWSWVGWEGEIMTVDWKHYFYHLHRSGRWLVKIASNTALGRSNLNRPDIPVIPAVTWFYGQTLLERFPVKASGHTNIKYMTDVSLPLPPGWARINSGYLFGGQENKFSAYPLPISSNQVSRTVSARYLFGRTTRAYLKSAKGTKYPILSSERVTQLSTHLKDSSGHLIGEVNLNLAQLNFQEPKAQTEFELVVISAGEISGTAQVGEGAYGGTASVHRLSLPDGFGWAKSHFDFPLGLMSSTKSTTPVHQLIGIYHVLWIEWENGIAYRKGLGRVLKEAWDRMATEEIDLVLG